ncbi:MAG: diaminopimelate epimerase [Zetaproteobacteria bacterium CG12_big_fil_rev_8_21_14_0_65_54_13]|nr:MAG: diaminopimelate epimerase [Zetaproteobacteria bacterium CG12_big_fil_rev_8_21_14_0_65_54_13]PIX55601.1 MAG: diaminopimelate epimerase [Zetaproteobacteria bacterium CG_4_10_14_3_um_filter_54_28]PJA27727.1 MAG: diaminopimelate epimerase [Zetaproteobacteria bacterium CG_4_9_14_3_um_filter_54_145]
MTALPFTKMQAQGNDFIVLNGLTSTLPELTTAWVRRITERRYGIGCDQLLVLEQSDSADAAMRIFNNDGSKAANCGNGLRCVGQLLMQLLGKEMVSIALGDRIVYAETTINGICVDMGAATVTGSTESHVDIDIGNLHRVFFEATEAFPSDRNVEIVTGQIASHVYIDIIERGAGRTLACGSGACATAAAIWSAEGEVRPLTIEMPGGTVTVSGCPKNIKLEGPVTQTFSGVFTL